MIQKLRNNKGAVARFGQGTVKIKPYTLKTRFGAQVELTSCSRAEIGAEAAETIPHSNKIVLDFSNVESLDVLIEKLTDLRSDLVNEVE